MKNRILLLIFFGLPYIGQAQEVERKLIEGKIIAAPEFDLEGIAIYNQNTEKGTISDKNGLFTIRISVGDSLVLSALQFQEVSVVITEKNVASGNIIVNISEVINQLPEVVISPHELTGVLKSDIERIKVEETKLPTWSASEIQDMDLNFAADAASKVENSAIRDYSKGQGNVLGLLSAGVQLIASLFPEKKEEPVYFDIKNVEDKLRNLFDEAFFVKNLKLEKEKIGGFLYFVEDEGLSSKLLENGKQLELIAFLMQKAEEFKSARP